MLAESLVPQYYQFYEAYSTPFMQTYREILRETNIISTESYLQESVTDPSKRSILIEAVENKKNFLVRKFERLIEILRELTNRFINMANNIINKNKMWLKKFREDMKFENIPADYSYQIYPYWKNMDLMLKYQFPEFQESSSQFMELLQDEEEFKKRYFKNLYVKRDGEEVFDPREVFRGGPEKIEMDKELFISKYQDMINFIMNYRSIINIIVGRTNRLIEFIKRTITKIKSTLFKESDYISSTVDILLEDTATLTKEEEKTGTATEDKREEGKSVDAEHLNEFKARQTYNKIIYNINSARMTIVENCYTDYVKALHLAIYKNLQQRKEGKKQEKEEK